MVDSILSEGLTDPQFNYSMGVTAENVAARWKITREEQDAFALESQRRAAAANAAGAFAEELIPVNVPSRKGPTASAQDEHVRPETSLEARAKLRPAF